MVDDDHVATDDVATPAALGERQRQGKKVEWTAALRGAFFDHLAATCNVSESALVAGVTKATIYEFHRKDARFRAEWAEALAAGYQMLETRLVGQVLAGRGRIGTLPGAGAEIAQIDFDAAMLLLNRDRSAKPNSPKRRRTSPSETADAILKKLKLVEARLAKRAAGDDA